MSRYKQPYSLYKRGKYWYFRTYTPDGIRTHGISTGQTNKTLAKEFCDKLYLTGGLYSSSITLKEYAAHFLDDNAPYVKDRTKALSPNSLRSYRNNLQTLFDYAGDVKLCDINYTYLKAVRSKLLEHYKASSVTKMYTIFKSIITTAQRDNLIVRNPFDMLDALKWEGAKRDAFRWEELITLIKELPEYYKPWAIGMALTGTRISEYAGITDEDIKTTPKGLLYIDLQRQIYKDGYKSLKYDSVRPIPIIEPLTAFFNRDRTKIATLYRYFEPIKNTFENHEERLLSLHSFRHFFISDSKAKNINPQKVEKLVGHRLDGEQETYTHFTADDLADITFWQLQTYNAIIQEVGEINPNPKDWKR